VTTSFKSGFLAGLAEPNRRSILGAGIERRFSANSVVVHQEDPADRLFLITEGRGRFFFVTENGRKLVLDWLSPGDIFGAGALLYAPSHYLVSVEMLKDSRVLVWNRATIRRLAGCYPRLLDNALSIARDYLAWYVTSRASLASHNARQRLAHVLVNLAQGIGHATPEGVELKVSNEELASAANITPFTASRLLNQWQRGEALIKSRGKVLLRSPDGLLVRST
jgi:CRP/FNR family cyclic AMP-dependent transcriptional regulator